MCCVRFTISVSYRKVVESHLKTAQHLGRLRQVKHLLAILAVLDGQSLHRSPWSCAYMRRPSRHGSRRFVAMGSRTHHAPSPPVAHPN